MMRKLKIQLKTLEPLPPPFPPETYTVERSFRIMITSSVDMEDVHDAIRENLRSFIDEYRIDVGDTVKVLED